MQHTAGERIVFQIQPMRQSEQRFSRRSTTSTRLLNDRESKRADCRRISFSTERTTGLYLFSFCLGRKADACHDGQRLSAWPNETVENPDGTLPLLIPMSEVAGRMSIQEGARF